MKIKREGKGQGSALCFLNQPGNNPQAVNDYM
jgi:hypothetical protein